MQVWFGMTLFPLMKHLYLGKGALEALQCIICHYLRTDGITADGITADEQIRPSIIIDTGCPKKKCD